MENQSKAVFALVGAAAFIVGSALVSFNVLTGDGPGRASHTFEATVGEKNKRGDTLYSDDVRYAAVLRFENQPDLGRFYTLPFELWIAVEDGDTILVHFDEKGYVAGFSLKDAPETRIPPTSD